jgi:hypothetical protein
MNRALTQLGGVFLGVAVLSNVAAPRLASAQLSTAGQCEASAMNPTARSSASGRRVAF